eukprot:TRINITY_DN3394_c0_g1_i9.p1 TRINITY_DN3394_c0_g1~~TRINITY_DN3394_c0_g1_i9.p1  ORF type:complete len:550 (+),score=63.97 TRINITY_DN3394_c0_g1_i9:46-1695(+)
MSRVHNIKNSPEINDQNESKQVHNQSSASIRKPIRLSKNRMPSRKNVAIKDAPLAYSLVSKFFNMLMETFFRDVELVGMEHIPDNGATFIAGNHFNQFVDAMLLVAYCPRIISFLMAAKSFTRPVVGWFATKIHAIPVIRPQDNAIIGKGTIVIQGGMAIGTDTSFLSQAEVGGSIMVATLDLPCKISRIVSDTEIALDDVSAHVPSTSYKLLKKVFQANLYESVYEGLSRGGCVGIFPEGGSHDRTTMLPLKPGIAVMALGYVDRHQREVKIVPCGFTYFSGHRFRSQVVIEYAPPIVIKPGSELLELYRIDRPNAYRKLLEQLKQNLESVTLTASTYEDISAFHLARQLYQSATNSHLTASERAFLTRLFLQAYQQDTTHAELQEFKVRLLAFRHRLRSLGLKPHQIKDLKSDSQIAFLTFIARFLQTVVLFVLSAPGFIFNLPVLLVVLYLSWKEMVQSKAASNVKVKGVDVVASRKIIATFVFVPLVYSTYLIATYLILMALSEGSLRWLWPAVGLLLSPLLAYFTIKTTEKGVMSFRTMRPLVR